LVISAALSRRYGKSWPVVRSDKIMIRFLPVMVHRREIKLAIIEQRKPDLLAKFAHIDLCEQQLAGPLGMLPVKAALRVRMQSDVTNPGDSHMTNARVEVITSVQRRTR
jgi:hypothetical protein